MAKIRTSNVTSGRPGFKTKGATRSVFTGKRLSKNRVSVRGVTRLFARDPSKRTANIGTSKDVNPINNTNVNTVATPRPTIVRGGAGAARRSTPAGQQHVVSRTVNRAIRRLR